MVFSTFCCCCFSCCYSFHSSSEDKIWSGLRNKKADEWEECTFLLNPLSGSFDGVATIKTGSKKDFCIFICIFKKSVLLTAVQQKICDKGFSKDARSCFCGVACFVFLEIWLLTVKGARPSFVFCWEAKKKGASRFVSLYLFFEEEMLFPLEIYKLWKKKKNYIEKNF